MIPPGSGATGSAFARARTLGLAPALSVAALTVAALDDVALSPPIRTLIAETPSARPLAEDIARAMMETAPCRTDPAGRKPYRIVIRNVRLRARLSTDHPHWLRQILKPTYEDMQTLPLPRGLRWLYPALRPALSALRHLSRS